MTFRANVFFLACEHGLGNENSTFRADFDAFSTMGASFLTNSVGGEPTLILHCFQTFDGEVLADLPALIAHRALVGIDFVANEIAAFHARAHTLDVAIKVLGMFLQKSTQNVGVILAFLAHTAILYIQRYSLKLGNMFRSAFAGLYQFENLDGVINAEFAGMALGAHAVL